MRARWTHPEMASLALLGFSSGLPLFLTSRLLQRNAAMGAPRALPRL